MRIIREREIKQNRHTTLQFLSREIHLYFTVLIKNFNSHKHAQSAR